MKRAILLTVLVCTMSLLAGCKILRSGQKTEREPKELIQKSQKRGIAYDLKAPADLNALKSGVSWWYNWYYDTDAPKDYYDDYQMEFIPMLWGGNGPKSFKKIKKFILKHPEIKYLLVLNEPNLLDQANQTPQKAAAEWVKYEKLIDELDAKGRDIALVGPAITWGTLPGYSDPITWLDDFYQSYRNYNRGKEPLIDYLAFHWYDYGLEDQLNRLEKYGKDIWITEMANWNPVIDSYEKMAEQMREMVALCESRDDVFRYAWFIGRGADEHYKNLFNNNAGDLNDLGRLYISLPY